MSGFIECMKSELDFFESPPIQTSVIKTEEICYDARSTHLESCGWATDIFYLYNSLTEKENPGFDKRKKLFKDGKKVELFGKLHVDVFNQQQ